MPAPAKIQTEPGLVRWILEVSLGCSLGLLLVYAVINRRLLPAARPPGLQVVRPKDQAPETPYSVSDDRVERELRTVISSQLSDFRKGDYPEAYDLAASSLKSQVPLPAFERMVKKLYPVIAQSDSARFGVMLDNGRFALANVTVVGATGRVLHYEYALQRERYGWKIAGVAEVKISGVTL